MGRIRYSTSVFPNLPALMQWGASDTALAFVVTDSFSPVPIIWPRLTSRRFELPASLRRSYFLKAELLVEPVVRLTVDLDIRVDEVIERWAILPRRQCDVATGG